MSSPSRVLALLVLGLVGACGGGGGADDVDAALAIDAASPDAADLCEAPPALPRPYETLNGFPGGEDFVFDAEGWIVASDDQGNIVRVSREGETQLVSPAVTETTAGLRFLPGGDLVVASVSEGSLIRVTPDGSTSVILSGLDYPNGIDVTADGSIYVAEQNAGRVRKVDPDTGEFTVVGLGMVNPNGIVVADDGRTIYVGSFGAGTVYQIQIDASGRPTTPRIFGRTPEAPYVDPPRLPCATLAEGAPCVSQYGLPGTCEDYGGLLDCFGDDTCGERVEGDRCVSSFGGPGRCQTRGDGLVCADVDQCFDRGAGDPCEDAFGLPGLCVPAGGGAFACEEVSCAGRSPGSSCTTPWDTTGSCEVYEGIKLCFAFFPCESSPDGAGCLDFHGLPGVCYSSGGYGACYAQPGCAISAAGDRCLTPEGLFGTCTGDGGALACTQANGCVGRPEGALCELDEDLVGVCHDDGGGGGIACTRRDPCVDQAAGDVCRIAGMVGQCEAPVGGGALACVTIWEPFLLPCDGFVLGDACGFEADGTTYAGACSDWGGRLFCQAAYDLVTPCAGKAADDACDIESPYSGPITGTCENDAGGLACAMPDYGDGTHGGLDGIATDACGYVYVTEYILGQIWRFSPDGGPAELAVQLPSQWIPNLHWGTGQDGWSSSTLWVADRDEGRLFGVDLGVAGAPEVFPPQEAP